MNKIIFHPVISCIQKVVLYEDKTTFIVIGSNKTETKFRVLKIDRTDSQDLVLIDDRMEYSKLDIVKLLERHEPGRPKTSRRPVIAAYGILGFVRFLEGYYIVLITKRQPIAVIGHHTIYKVKDTNMVYLPLDVARSQNPTEIKYYKIFQNIDLSSNFYFSYDLTHTLQSNLTPPSDFPSKVFEENLSKSDLHFAVRSEPSDRFAWNWSLTKPIRGKVHPDWLLHLIHGFVDQSNVSVYGRSIYVTLIARRSRKYAGTRFLKRGSNCEGDVANEVETEQMVHDTSISSFRKGYYTSFVQMRGSIPGHWSQDVSKMVPKPQIIFDIKDPFGETSGQHFNQLLRHYGAPVIILNLVKKRETKKQESVLSCELINYVAQLNQFLPPKYHIRYTSFDMARMNKTKDTNVMQRLADIAKRCVQKTGIFVSRHARKQTGVVRVNCVDCLDRTNTAQFAVGRYALGAQLCALGILSKPHLEFDTDCVRMLEALYEDHGDTLALQYGGSQLVHRIKTYRKTAPWTSQGNDIMQTLSRYYSNTFSDAEKQNAINLFLGLYKPYKADCHIWDNLTDYYLHHSWAMGKFPIRTLPSSQWWDPEILTYLPMSYEEMTKKSVELYAVQPQDEAVDAYSDYHRPHELTVFGDNFIFKISHSVRDFMPHFTTNFSPFAVRIRPGRRREESGKLSVKNPSLTGQSSTSSTTSSGSSSSETNEESLSEDELQTDSINSKIDEQSQYTFPTFLELFLTMSQVYGTEPKHPSKADYSTYERYVKIYKNSNQIAAQPTQEMFKPRKSSMMTLKWPKISEESLNKYLLHVEKGLCGALQPDKKDMSIYCKYVIKA